MPDQFSPKLNLFPTRKSSSNSNQLDRWWWCMPFIPALRRQRAGGSEFEANLVYYMSSRTAKPTERNCISSKSKQKCCVTIMYAMFTAHVQMSTGDRTVSQSVNQR